MIVMKFGGTSVGDAQRVRGVAEIVSARRDRRPLVVVSAVGGVTDLLTRAVEAAGRDDRDEIDRTVAEVERLNRWVLAGSVEDPGRRHHLGLEVAALFEELRSRLRSIRILGEVGPRAADAVLAVGEQLSSRIVAAALCDAGLQAVWLDPCGVMVTDRSFGDAEPSLEAVRSRASGSVLPRLASGEIPVTGGFVGATEDGETSTLGRGGSDTSAAVLGLALDAEEIQIWTDVDGLMSADPSLVPGARTLSRVSFVEAADLAQHGARVLHPASIAPAVARRIPVRVLNASRPDAEGTLILPDAGEAEPRRAVAVTARRRVRLSRAHRGDLRVDPALGAKVLAHCVEQGVRPELWVACGNHLALVTDAETTTVTGPQGIEWETEGECALIGVVGHGLTDSGALRQRVGSELSRWTPRLMVDGASRTSVLAVIADADADRAVRELHRRFFEGEEAA